MSIPLTLRLKGSKGIKDGLGLEDLILDLTKFKPGLIAIVGPNGSGKTTIINNLHGHRRIATKKGGKVTNIIDEFYQRDSLREFEQLINGKIYKSRMMMDAKTGKMEAYLYEDGRPLNDGLNGSYDLVYEKLMGSADIFFRAIIVTKSADSISKLKDAERKRLFLELLALERYEMWAEEAKKEAEAIEKEIERLDTQISQLEAMVGDVEGMKASLDRLRVELATKESELVVSQAKTAQADKDIAELSKKIDAQESIKKQIEELNLRIEKETVRFSTEETKFNDSKSKAEVGRKLVQEEIDRLNRIVSNKPTIESKMAWIALTRGIITGMEAKQLEVQKNRLELSESKNKHALLMQEHAKLRETVEAALRQAQGEIRDLKFDSENQVGKIKQDAEREHAKGMAKYQMDMLNLANELTADSKLLEGIQRGHDAFVKDHEQRITEANRTHGLIDEVPCKAHETFPGECKLLADARSAKTTAETLTKEMEDENDKFIEEISVARRVVRVTTNKIEALKDTEPKPLDFHGNAELLAAGEKYFDKLEELQKAEEIQVDALRDLVEPAPHDEQPFIDQYNAIGFDAKELRETREKFEIVVKENWEKFSEELKTAEAVLLEKKHNKAQYGDMIVHYDDQLVDNKNQYDQIVGDANDKLEELLVQVDADLWTKLTATQEVKAELEANTKTINEDISGRKVSIGMFEKNISEAEVFNRELTKWKDERATKIEKATDWRFLQRACGKDGIPALELDLAGPTISNISNELLSSTFGTRFQIRFDTAGETKKGVQKEVFDIKVLTDVGIERDIEDLSEGQTVWVETAISEGVALYMNQQSGRQYGMSARDEADGTLDAKNKQHYLDMLRETHRIGNRHFTFVVSQTPAVYEQIQQQIRLIPGKGIEYVY